MRIGALVLAVIAAGGCPYTMGPRPAAPWPRIAVAECVNRTAEVWLGQALNRELRTALAARTDAVVCGPGADAAVVTCVLARAGRDILGQDAAGAVTAERISIEVAVTVTPPAGPSRAFRVVGSAAASRTGLQARDRLLGAATADAAARIVDHLIDQGMPTNE
ncbi:MAG: LPS assembly lipoprotein LptE [Planctomycetota bacterium]